MSFANIVNLLSAGGVAGASTVVGSAVSINTNQTYVVPERVGQGPLGIRVIGPNPDVASTYPLPENMRNAKAYLISLSGSASITDANALPPSLDLYFTNQANGGDVDGTETYLTWIPTGEGTVEPVNILNFQTTLNYTGVSTRGTVPNPLPAPPAPPAPPSDTVGVTPSGFQCVTNQMSFWFYPETGTETSELFLIANNPSDSTYAFNTKSELTIRAVAFF
jgi:hypothetical protein